MAMGACGLLLVEDPLLAALHVAAMSALDVEAAIRCPMRAVREGRLGLDDGVNGAVDALARMVLGPFGPVEMDRSLRGELEDCFRFHLSIVGLVTFEEAMWGAAEQGLQVLQHGAREVPSGLRPRSVAARRSPDSLDEVAAGGAPRAR